jgi:hypothetical protein
MEQIESYVTGKRGEEKSDKIKKTSDKEIEQFIEEVGLNKNGNKCRLEKKLIYDIVNIEALSFKENIPYHKSVKNIIEKNKKSEFVII